MRISVPKIIEEDHVVTITMNGIPISTNDPMYMHFLQYIYQAIAPEYLEGNYLDLNRLFERFLNNCGMDQETHHLDLEVIYDYETDHFLKNPVLELSELLNSTKVYEIEGASNLNGLSITKIMEKNGIERDITTKGFTPVSFGFIGESPDDK